MRRLLLLCLIAGARVAHAAEPVVTVEIPQMSCRVASCAAVGNVQAIGGAIPAGATLVRWDGATFTAAAAAAAGGTTAVSSPNAIYDVPIGEELAVQDQPGVVAIVTESIRRHQVGAGAGPVRFAGVTVALGSEGYMSPPSVSVPYSDDYPPEFIRAARQFALLRYISTMGEGYGLSPEAVSDMLIAAQVPPRDAETSAETRPAVTEFAFGNTSRTTYPAPVYTEQRIPGPPNTAQALEVCFGKSIGQCQSRVLTVRPENLDTVYLHCRAEDGVRIDGDCAWLRAHQVVERIVSRVGRGLAEPGNPQRVFFGYSGGAPGDFVASRYVYGGDVLPPEAEYAIFDRVLSEFQE